MEKPKKRNRKVVVGVNDVATTHPHLIEYFVDKQEATLNYFSSRKRVLIKCPVCGHERNVTIKDFCRCVYPCYVCSDNISYPEKFLLQMLKQLEIEFNHQLSKGILEWCGNKKYDFYIPSLNCIVETHGEQHYIESFTSRNLEREQANDLAKEILAKGNGIKHYIVLDCRKSELEWIKNSIMNSELPKLLNFNENDVDWSECAKKAISSKTVEIWDIWNNGVHDIEQISFSVGLTVQTVRRHLTKGTELGIVNYTKKQTRAEGHKKRAQKVQKKVKILETNQVFDSISDLVEKSFELFGEQFTYASVGKVCRGNAKEYKNLHFEYIE